MGASVDRSAIPLADGLRLLCDQNADHYVLALSGGDDYELCFCVAPQHEAGLQAIANDTGIRLTRIGQIEQQAGIRLYDAGHPCALTSKPGFEHFSG